MVDPVEPSTRELYHQWLRVLTLLAMPDNSLMPERLALIRQVNQRGGVPPQGGKRTDTADGPQLPVLMRAAGRVSGREAAAHAVVTGLLLRWLSEATGDTQSEIITRLAQAIDAILPPDASTSM